MIRSWPAAVTPRKDLVMSVPFKMSGAEKRSLDAVLNGLSMTELKKLVQWDVGRKNYSLDGANRKNDQTFELIENAESQGWLAVLVVNLKEFHPETMSGLDGLSARASEAIRPEVSVAEPGREARGLTERHDVPVKVAQAAGVPEQSVSSGKELWLKTEVSAMENDFFSAKWWGREDLNAFVDRWQGLLVEAHVTINEFRRNRWPASVRADIWQLSLLDSIEVASGAFDQAEETLIGLRDFRFNSGGNDQIFKARRAFRHLVVAVEDVVGLRSSQAGDAPTGDLCDEPLSVPMAALAAAVTGRDSDARLPAALEGAAPFVTAVAYYITGASYSSEDSLAAIARLVSGLGSCALPVHEQAALAGGPQDVGRWTRSARKLSEDSGAVLTELDIYRQAKRRHDRQDMAQAEGVDGLKAQLRELAESRDRVGRACHQLVRSMAELRSMLRDTETNR